MTMKKTTTNTFISKIKTFIKSLWNHILTGMKKSSSRQIKNRYKTCLACPYITIQFDSHGDIRRSTCGKCGCNLSDKKEFMNKLAWKDQNCPEGRW